VLSNYKSGEARGMNGMLDPLPPAVRARMYAQSGR